MNRAIFPVTLVAAALICGSCGGGGTPIPSFIWCIGNRAGGWDIYRMDANGANVSRFTSTNLTESSVTVSPDGTMLAFERNTTQSPTGGQTDIFIIDIDGTNQMVLTTNTGDDRNPSFNHDGSKIVYTQSSGGFNVVVMNSDGSDKTQLTFDNASYDASFSPDGQQIAFRRGINIWVMDTDGSNQSQLTNNGDLERQPTWSPDGSMIVYVRRDTADDNVWIMNANGSSERKVLQRTGHDNEPIFNLDGSKIIFVYGGSDGLASMDLTGANFTVLASIGSYFSPSTAGTP